MKIKCVGGDLDGQFVKLTGRTMHHKVLDFPPPSTIAHDGSPPGIHQTYTERIEVYTLFELQSAYGVIERHYEFVPNA